MECRIQFLGAARQVTGSRYLLNAGGLRLMIDCGMFQERKFLERNWEPPPVSPDSVDHLILTHAHLDHTGLIPKFVSHGFSGPILCTPPTRDLTEIILLDAAHIQEEDAKFKTKRHQREGRSGPRPVTPLYVTADAQASMELFHSAPYSQSHRLNDNVSVTFHDAGHILGSAILEFKIDDQGRRRTIVFSGDIGQWNRPLIHDPSLLERADYLVMESTYGNRNHAPGADVEAQLEKVINETVAAGGNILIPTFAVERAQELLYHLARLLEQDRIPNLLAFLDSPMAVDVTEVFRKHRDYLDADAQSILDSKNPLLRFPGLKLVRDVNGSKGINRIKGSCIILAGSGMCTAGRIKHHLVQNISRPESTVVFVGYQAEGTLGRLIVDGADIVRIHGHKRHVKARITQIQGFSAHADQDGLLKWITHLKSAPRRVFLTHGELDAANTLAEMIRHRLNCPVDVPEYQSEHELD